MKRAKTRKRGISLIERVLNDRDRKVGRDIEKEVRR